MIIVVDNTYKCRTSNNCNLLVKLLLANEIEHVIVSETKDIEKIEKYTRSLYQLKFMQLRMINQL